MSLSRLCPLCSTYVSFSSKGREEKKERYKTKKNNSEVGGSNKGEKGQTRDMIGLLTKVKIVDNSGAVEGRCIHIYGKKDKGFIGDTVLLSITSIAKGSSIKRGEKYKATVVRIKKGEKNNPFITR
jgi:hypothetical protein